MKNDIKNDTRASAVGKWRAILTHFGFTEKELSGKHGPCPLCEGSDRFRYTDYKDGGEYFCSGCGPGSGFDLLMGKMNWDFAHSAQEVDKLLGTDIEQVFKPRVDTEKRRRDMNAVWRNATDETIVPEWLKYRGIEGWNRGYADLRGHPSMFMAASSDRHRAMLALVRNKDGAPIAIHRTYIDAKQRKVMPPIETIKGAGIRLGEYLVERKTVVIGEGIETVLSGMDYFLQPGIATISAAGMEEIIVPEHYENIIILADNDLSFTGQKAAFTLARRLDNKKKTVRVVMPSKVDTDFNDNPKTRSYISWDNGRS